MDSKIPPVGKGSRLSRLQQRAHALKAEALALYFAVRDPRTPWYAKALAVFVVAHTFSPIDLIPDFIPVLGLLDDIIITPAGIWLALRLIPLPVMQNAREKARERLSEAKPVSWAGAALIVIIWLALAALSVILIFRAV